jgi:hypothetical protein
MSLVVTGISQTSDLSALEAALGAAGHSLEPLTVVDAGDEARPSVPQSPLAMGSIGQIDTGTGVPGLTSGTTSLGGGPAFFRDETLSARLADFEIPDDEIDNYLEAIAAGRSVVGYFAKQETIDSVESAFRAAGLAKIKRF